MIEEMTGKDLRTILRFVGVGLCLMAFSGSKISLAIGVVIYVALRVMEVKVLENPHITVSLSIYSSLVIIWTIYQAFSNFFVFSMEDPTIMESILNDILYTPPVVLGLSLTLQPRKNLLEKIYHDKKLPDLPPLMGADAVHSPEGAIIGWTPISKSEQSYVTLPFVPGKHILLTGSSGGGKTATISNAIEYNAEYEADGHHRGVIVIDGKADRGEYSLYQLMLREAKRTGRTLHVIDISKPTEQIDIFREMDAVAVKDTLMGMTEWSEAHYESSAALYFEILADVLIKAGEVITFRNLAFFCQEKELLALVNHLHKNGIISKETLDSYSTSIKDTSEIARQAKPRFANFAQGLGEKVFSQTVKDCGDALFLPEAYAKGDMVLIMINTLSYSAYAHAVGSLVLSSVKQLISKIQTCEIDQRGLFLVLDEIGQYISPTVTQIYSLGRSAGIQAVAVCQSLADLEKGEDGTSTKAAIVSNCSYFITMSISLPDDAQELADVFSTHQDVERTFQTTWNDRSGMGTAKVVDRYLVHPRELKSLPDLVGYAVFKGEEKEPIRFTTRFVDFSSIVQV